MPTRRGFLAACGAVGCTVSAGCGGSLLTSGTALVSHSFQRSDLSPGDDRIRVAFDEAEGEVRVTGFAYYGSSSCDKPVVESTSYDEAADTLVVRVGHDQKLLAFGCTGDMAGTGYRVVARFTGGLPKTVRVVERNEGGETEVETVERDEDAETAERTD